MDNVTHSLIGIVAAEPLALSEKPEHRVKLWVASAVANNLPDLDVLYTYGSHDRLTYLLHHRGHSHTLLLAPLESLAWFAILRLWWRKIPGLPWRSLAALCFLGPLLHLFADSWNSYGIHPFWPFNDQWFYGDVIFIVEPLLWAIFLPLIWNRAATSRGKGTALLLLATMAALIWYHPLISWPVALAITLFALFWMALQRAILSDRRKLVALFTFVVTLFFVFGWAEIGLKRSFAGEGQELVAMPNPGNPFCWTMLAAGFEGDRYHAAAWTAAAWPALVPATSCRAMLRSGPTAVLSPLSETASAARVPIGVFRGTRAELDDLSKNCRVRAFLRFARVPYWKIKGTEKRVGDLRFDSGFSFAVISGDDESCPSFEPPWVGPFFPLNAAPSASK